MKAKYSIDNCTFSFCAESIRKRYSKKEDFIKDMIRSHPHVDAKRLKDLLEKVWKEVFAQEKDGETSFVQEEKN